MNRKRLFLLAVVALLALAACERPLRETPAATATPPSQAPVIPVVPTPAPAVEQPATEGQAGQEGAVEGETEPGATEGTETENAGTEGGESGQTDTGEPAAPPTDVIHVVQAGDTLGKLAEQYGVSIEDIARANNITNVNVLSVGQELLIPLSGTVTPPEGQPAQEQVYVVQPGDTLYSIGRRYGFTVEELAAYNGITDINRLSVGQEIKIPPKQ